MTDRWLDLQGVANMRDLGGLPTRDGGRTVPGRLIRSDNLRELTAADIRLLVDELGITDIVDLRSDTELRTEGDGPLRRLPTLTHHHHSLFADDHEVTAQEALVVPSHSDRDRRDAAYWSEHYLGYLATRPDSVAAALGVVADARGGTVVHCAAGKDRTGTVVALALDVAGVPHEEIVTDYALSAERIERIIARLRGRPAYSEMLATQVAAEQTPRGETMTTILEALTEGWGGAGGWLREQGWSGEDVQRLRRRLTG